MGQLQACGESTVSGRQCGGSRCGQIKLERRNEHAGQQQHGPSWHADAAMQRRRSVSTGAKEHFFALMTRRC